MTGAPRAVGNAGADGADDALGRPALGTAPADSPGGAAAVAFGVPPDDGEEPADTGGAAASGDTEVTT